MKKKLRSITGQRRISFIALSAVGILAVIFSSIVVVYALQLFHAETAAFAKITATLINNVQLSDTDKTRLYDILKRDLNKLNSNLFIDQTKLKAIKLKIIKAEASGDKQAAPNLSYDIEKIGEAGLEKSYFTLAIITALLIFLLCIIYLFTIFLPDRRLQNAINSITASLAELETGKYLNQKEIGFRETAQLIKHTKRVINRTLDISRMHAMLSAVNQVMIKAKTESQIFSDICKIFVEQGKFRLAWIGILDEKTHITQTYFCGDESYVNFVVKSLNKNLSTGPTSKAIKRKSIFINNDTAGNRLLKPWSKEMLRRDYLSSASLPIIKKDKLMGILNIYTNRLNFFRRENFNLLNEIADDIHFVLDKIENEKWQNITMEALEKGSSYIVIIDKNLTITYTNKAANEIFAGNTEGKLSDEHCNIINNRLKNKPLTNEFFDNLLKKKKAFNDLLIYTKKDGSLAYLDTKITHFKMRENHDYFILHGKEITKEVKLQNSINKMLFYDFETNLPNRHVFLKSAESYIKTTGLNKQAALVIIDPRNFAYINDVQGFENGGRLLKAIGVRLTKILKSSDLVAKASGSRFYVLVKEIDVKYSMPDILKRIQNVLDKPFNINSKEIRLSFHIGISIYPNDAQNASDLLSRAETALFYNKKSKSEKPYSFFTEDIERDIKKSEQLKEALSNALKQKEFFLHYQPYFEPISKTISGAEALLRWKKDGKTIMPAEFIQTLEKSNMIADVEKWIIDQTCSDMREWQEKGLKLTPISINISPKSFTRPDLTHNIFSAAERYRIDPALLTVEITERLFMSDLDYSKKILANLKEKGIRIAIDDFGTGFSSLSYLEQLPIDILKIDISFVQKITSDRRSAAIVQSIIAVAQALSLSTVAEGVETVEQLDILTKLNCDNIQGWLFAKAMPKDQFELFLTSS